MQNFMVKWWFREVLQIRALWTPPRESITSQGAVADRVKNEDEPKNKNNTKEEDSLKNEDDPEN